MHNFQFFKFHFLIGNCELETENYLLTAPLNLAERALGLAKISSSLAINGLDVINSKLWLSLKYFLTILSSKE